MTHAALSTRLPSIASERARLQSALLAALDGAACEGLALRASLAEAAATPAIRFSTAAGDIEIVPVLGAGGVPMLVADDGEPDAVASMAALAALEPVVATIERQLGIVLRPVAVAHASLALWLRIESVGRDGRVRDALLLGVAADSGLSPQPLPPRLDERVHALRLRFAFAAAGPQLGSRALSALARGDLVLVGGPRLAGSVEAGTQRLPATYEPQTATITIANQGNSRVTDTDSPTRDDGDLQLALTLRIEGGSVTLGDLARLTAGSVLPLGIEGVTMPVTLEVGGAAVATGELVAIGEAYGVLITRRVGAAT